MRLTLARMRGPSSLSAWLSAPLADRRRRRPPSALLAVSAVAWLACSPAAQAPAVPVAPVAPAPSNQAATPAPSVQAPAPPPFALVADRVLGQLLADNPSTGRDLGLHG